MRVVLFASLILAGCVTSEPVGDAGVDLGGDAGDGASDASHDAASDGGPEDGPHDGSTDGASEDGSVCPDGYWHERPPYDRGCATDADCTIAFWWTSCCTAHAGGIATAAYAAFRAVNDACDAHAYHDCGCPMYALADDGAMVLAAGGVGVGVGVGCDGHICVTSAPCGTGGSTCAAPTGYCGATCGPSGVTTACMPPPPACDGGGACACLAAADASPCGGGTCTDFPAADTFLCSCR